jgi:hypothetical protein
MRWRRWVILAVLLPVYAFVLGELGLALGLLVAATHPEFRDLEWILQVVTEASMHPVAWTGVFLPAMVAALAQLMFLLPVVKPSMVRSEHGRTLWLSVIGAGFVAALLFVALLMAIGEGVHWLVFGETDLGDWVADTAIHDMAPLEWWVFWPYVLIGWMIWTPLLWVFTRRAPRNRLPDRLAGWLLAGTIAEVIVVLPLDLMVRRKSDCYCATGTFWALVTSGLALLWLAGPGIVLAVTSKRRRAWFEMHCEKCGYAKGPSPGQRCPECGHEWRGAPV